MDQDPDFYKSIKMYREKNDSNNVPRR